MFVLLTHTLFDCQRVLAELISQDGCRRMRIDLNFKQTRSSLIWIVDDNMSLNIKRYLMKVKAVAELEWWWSKPVWDCKGAAAGQTGTGTGQNPCNSPCTLNIGLCSVQMHTYQYNLPQHRFLQCTDAHISIQFAPWTYEQIECMWIECISVQSTQRILSLQ